LSLAGVGVGRITVIDPQVVESDNFNRLVFAADKDLHTPKVEALRRTLRDRHHLRYTGIASACETSEASAAMEQADILFSASNSVQSRRFAASVAVKRRIAHVYVGVDDARLAFGGTVGAWIPERRDLACHACFLTKTATRPSSEAALVTTAIAAVSSLAAHWVVRLATADDRRQALDANVIRLSLDGWRLEALLVRRNPECRTCRLGRTGGKRGRTVRL